jgi:ParB-like chromosome segregation protein Spo0J
MIEFPCLHPVWVPVERTESNDYNPNEVARQEMELLKLSIAVDGFTQPVVGFHDVKNDMYIIIDGFHRYLLLRDWFGCSHIPIVVLHKDIKDRMASTIRHNRARGKHQIALMVQVVDKLVRLGWNNRKIAKHLGMQSEEILRLRQERGIAEFYSHREYSRAWVWVDDEEDVDDKVEVR